MHLEWVVKAAEAGKHILVEKPVGVSEAEVAVMTAACEKNGVHFMDNVMFMHNERLAAIAEVLPTIGQVRRVTACAGFLAASEFLTGDTRDIRTQASADPLGCLGDVGWYNIRTIMFGNGWEMPKYVSAHALDVNEEGVVLTMAGILGYENSIATFDCGFDAPRAQLAEIVGTNSSRPVLLGFSRPKSPAFSWLVGLKMARNAAKCHVRH